MIIEFISDVLKGIQLPLFAFALIGIFFRIRERQWCKFDTLIFSCFVLYVLLSAFQVWMFYGILKTSSRYVLIALPLYLPFAALGVMKSWNWLRKNKISCYAAVAAAAAYLAINLYNTYSPLIKDRTSRKHRFERKMTLQAAEWIKNDWNDRKYEALTIKKCDHYHSGKRPLVASVLERTGYLAGGQNMTDFLHSQGVKPDYIAGEDKLPDGYCIVHTISLEKRTFYIARRIEQDL